MCQPRPDEFEPKTRAPDAADETKDASRSNSYSTSRRTKTLLDRMWPLHPSIVVALLPLLPRSAYLNRGYTVWFHLMSIGYLLSRDQFLRRVLILQGAGICLGWYAAILSDWTTDGTFCHTLYRNMPTSMVERMVEEMAGEGADGGGYVILNTWSSRATRGLSHVLDTIGHPGLAYLFYKLHLEHGGTIRDVFAWPVIVAAWHISRTWSVVHSLHNVGAPSWWYFGHDVYVLNDLNSYLVAYIVEGACFAFAVLCRVYWDYADRSPVLSSSVTLIEKDSTTEKMREPAPGLVHSESALSTSSMVG